MENKQDVATDTVKFPCPKCEFEIVRNKHDRMIATKYTCPKCGFEGPN